MENAIENKMEIPEESELKLPRWIREEPTAGDKGGCSTSRSGDGG